MCQDFPLHPRCDCSLTWSPSYPRSKLSSCGTSRGWTRRHWGCGWILSSSEAEAAWNHNHDRPDNRYRTSANYPFESRSARVSESDAMFFMSRSQLSHSLCINVPHLITLNITHLSELVSDWVSCSCYTSLQSAGRSSRLSGPPDKNWF